MTPTQATVAKAKAVENTDRRQARLAVCTRCSEPVLRGQPCDTVDVVVGCDLEPLSAVGEALAWLGGRETYRLTERVSGGYQLNGPRSQFDLIHSPQLPEVEILTRHRCGQPPLETLPAAPLADRMAPAAAQQVPDSEPPF